MHSLVPRPDTGWPAERHHARMGILDRIKKAFDHGGVKVAIVVGRTFRWSDDVLPVEITLTNSADEPRDISSVRLQLVEYDRDNPVTLRKVNGRYKGMNLFVNEPFRIMPGTEHAMHVDMPLTLRGAANEMGVEETPGWVDVLSNVVNTVSELNRNNEWYLLRVVPEVTGFTAKKIASKRIRNLRTGEWGGGIFTTRIGGK